MKLISLSLGQSERFTHPEDLSTVLARHYPAVCPDPAEWARIWDMELDARVTLAGIVENAQNQGLDRISSGGPSPVVAALSVGGDQGLCLVVHDRGEDPRGDYQVDLILNDDETATAFAIDLAWLATQRYGLDGLLGKRVYVVPLLRKPQ